MGTLLTLVLILVPLRLAYSLGKVNGRRQAVMYCDHSFITLLRATKQTMDDWLVKSAFTRSAPESFELEVNNLLYVNGNATEVAEWSMELGDLIGRIENLFPAHIHKQV